MSTVNVTMNKAHGVLQAPPSKSAAHRALIAAALSGQSCIKGILPSEDMAATLRCLAALGCRFAQDGNVVRFSGMGEGEAVADCGESGSSLRFFVPIFAALGRDVTFVGRGRLSQRPMTVYEACLPMHGISWERPACDGGIVRIRGRLTGGRYELAGDVSSQFVTGLLMALPLCREDSDIVLTSPLQSVGYVDMTLDVLRQAGVIVEQTADGYHVKGNQTYALLEHTVEGDWSQAAFLLTAGAVGGDVAVAGLSRDSLQGDRRIEHLLKDMGADIVWEGDKLCCKQSPLHGIDADVSDIPDLVPILSVAAAAAEGESCFYNAARLHLKESDRLQTTVAMLRALGATATDTADTLTVIGGKPLTGGTVDGANDHRIVMSAAVAALLTDDTVTVTDAHSIAKSWPSFFEDYKRMGGAVHEL